MSTVAPLRLSTLANQFGSFILGALSFTIALSWNAAIQAYFREQLKTDTSTYRGQFIYAAILTLIGSFLAYLIVRYTTARSGPKWL